MTSPVVMVVLVTGAIIKIKNGRDVFQLVMSIGYSRCKGPYKTVTVSAGTGCVITL
jgi:deoxycytidine triphosphate deaminase